MFRQISRLAVVLTFAVAATISSNAQAPKYITAQTENGKWLVLEYLGVGEIIITEPGKKTVVGTDSLGKPITAIKDPKFERIDTKKMPFSVGSKWGAVLYMPQVSAGDRLIFDAEIKKPDGDVI